MRIRSYYNENEIIPNLYTFGGEWQTTDGVEYKGLYHKYIPTDEVYTQSNWNRFTSVKLIKFKEIPADVKLYNKIKTDIQIGTQPVIPLLTYKPTPEDYTKGFITRYFLKKINENFIYEVDDIQYYDQLSNVIDLHLYSGAIVTWFISGETADVVNNNITTQGVITKNKLALKQAEKQIPGISKLITNVLQYYSDTEFVVPADINEN